MKRTCAVDVLHAQALTTHCGCHAQDATRKQIGVGDIVDVAAGRAKGKSGTVKYIHRQGLFLHVRWAALPCSVSRVGAAHDSFRKACGCAVHIGRCVPVACN